MSPSARTVAIVLLAGLACSAVLHAAQTESVVNSAAGSGSAIDRANKLHNGNGVISQDKLFRDPDPTVRIQALKTLAEQGGPEAKDLALEALDDSDPRVQSKALECLIQMKAKDAAPALVQRMFLKGSSPALRKRILTTLGAIGDAETARQLLDYASSETDPVLRGGAISALARHADPSLASALQGFVEKEKDPGIQRMASDALARLPKRTAP
jgi:HEAT repeat protein